MARDARPQRSAVERVIQVAVGLTVTLLAWPAEDEMRRQMSSLGLPRLLLVDAGSAPPEHLDAGEDWVRLPAEPADLQARAEAVVERSTAGHPASPTLDDDGLLHVGSAWAPLTPTQLPVARLLVGHMGRVVRYDLIAAACADAGGSGNPASVRTVLTRLAPRLRSVGLELVTIRQRGVMLQRAAPRGGD
jgi:hypothetical protein